MVKAYGRVLGMKTQISYEGKEIDADTAKRLIDDVDEIMGYVTSRLKPR